VGYFGLILANKDDENADKTELSNAVVLLGSGIIAIIFYIVLLVGVLMGKPSMIRIWVIFATFMVSLYIILLIIAIVFKLDIEWEKIAAGGVVILIRIYSIAIVRSFGSERRREMYEEYRHAIGPSGPRVTTSIST
jgi:ethanolamine transporter EutH